MEEGDTAESGRTSGKVDKYTRIFAWENLKKINFLKVLLLGTTIILKNITKIRCENRIGFRWLRLGINKGLL